MTAVPSELDQLLRHMAWADALVWTEALGVERVEADERIRTLLHHVHEVQHAYTQLIRGEEVDIPEVATFPTLRAVMAWGRKRHAELRALVEGLTSGAVQAAVAFPWAEQLAARYGRVHPTSVGQALLQLASHSTYHRGQIAARIRELGGEPPLSDFVVWVWRGQPEAEWPYAEGA